jgi:hypothetical protein
LLLIIDAIAIIIIIAAIIDYLLRHYLITPLIIDYFHY